MTAAASVDNCPALETMRGRRRSHEVELKAALATIGSPQFTPTRARSQSAASRLRSLPFFSDTHRFASDLVLWKRARLMTRLCTRRRDGFGFTSYVCKRPRRRRCARRHRRMGSARARARTVTQSAAGAARHVVRSVDRRNADGLHRLAADRANDQRLDPGSGAALARRRQRHAARRQSPARRGHVDPLARHDPARGDGRRAGAELSRHPSWRNLHLSIRRAAGRHLLVPQPFRLPGTARRLRPAGDRSARRRSDHVGSRARDPALRLDR